MDLHDGTPYWLLTHGLAPSVPPLDRDLRCDAAVIGGGITGALVADELTSRGLSTVILDRRDLGMGSTIASTALVTYDLDTPLFQLIPLIGVDRARRAFRVGIESIDRLDELCRGLNMPLERRSSLYYATESGLDDLAREHRARQEAGLAVQWLPRADLLSHVGLTAIGAIRSEGGAQLDPYRLCHALMRRVIDRGAIVHDRTTVTSRDFHTGRITLRTDRGPVIDAAHVIHATGYEAVGEFPPDLVQLRSTYAFVSEPTAPPPGLWPDRDMLWEFADPYLYVRWAGDRLLIGGEDDPYDDPAARDKLIPEKTRSLLRKFAEIMPGLTPEPAYAWAGTFATTVDGLPCIGPASQGSRELYALGFGGNGIVAATTAARLIADHITGRFNADAELYRLDRAVPARS